MLNYADKERMRSRLIFALTFVVSLLGIYPVSVANAETVSSTITSDLCNAGINEAGGMIPRLYRLYFNRLPDEGGLSYWSSIHLQQVSKGMGQHESVNVISYWMSQSNEYKVKWDGISNVDYVEQLLYNNLLDRVPDSDGIEYWVEILDDGRSRHLQAVDWVQAPELERKHPVVAPSDCGLVNMVQELVYDGRVVGSALEFDPAVTRLEASPNRCQVASINANWVYRDGFDKHIGFASFNRQDEHNGNVLSRHGDYGDDNSRGIFGVRETGFGPESFEWNYEPDLPTKVHSNILDTPQGMFQIQANNWITAPYPDEWWFESANWENQYDNWVWAVGGITVMVDGQISPSVQYELEGAHAGNKTQAYTYLTLRHPFVAINSSTGMVMLGAVDDATVPELVEILVAKGYTNIMKMDGGGSVEFNVDGSPVVGGTSRPLPIWLGVGC